MHSPQCDIWTLQTFIYNNNFGHQKRLSSDTILLFLFTSFFITQYEFSEKFIVRINYETQANVDAVNHHTLRKNKKCRRGTKTQITSFLL